MVSVGHCLPQAASPGPGDSGRRIAIDQLLTEVRQPPRVVGVFTSVGDAALLRWSTEAWEGRDPIGIVWSGFPIG
jgi:hypothetical protein